LFDLKVKTFYNYELGNNCLAMPLVAQAWTADAIVTFVREM
jgi:hypothetical protein